MFLETVCMAFINKHDSIFFLKLGNLYYFMSLRIKKVKTDNLVSVSARSYLEWRNLLTFSSLWLRRNFLIFMIKKSNLRSYLHDYINNLLSHIHDYMIIFFHIFKVIWIIFFHLFMTTWIIFFHLFMIIWIIFTMMKFPEKSGITLFAGRSQPTISVSLK